MPVEMMGHEMQDARPLAAAGGAQNQRAFSPAASAACTSRRAVAQSGAGSVASWGKTPGMFVGAGKKREDDEAVRGLRCRESRKRTFQRSPQR